MSKASGSVGRAPRGRGKAKGRVKRQGKAKGYNVILGSNAPKKGR